MAKFLIKGVPAKGRVASFKKSGRWMHVSKGAAGKKTAATKVAAPAPSSKYYQPDDVPKPLSSRKANRKPTKLRASITPGTVLIVLAGRFKGKRVVFLKQLESGLLMVTGPYKINGVPLRRFNQAYVIATTTKVDVSAVDVSAITDAFFAREAPAASAAGEFLEEEKPADVVSELKEKRKSTQKTVDAALMPAIKKVEFMRQYLNAKFSLSNGQYPHQLVF